jgi:hypothetical protein
MPFLQRMWGGCGPVGQWLTGNGAPVVWLFGLFCITMAARLQHNGAPIAAQRAPHCNATGAQSWRNGGSVAICPAQGHGEKATRRAQKGGETAFVPVCFAIFQRTFFYEKSSQIGH